MNNNEIFVGRQPIFNRNRQLYGYELLFRGGYNPNQAEFDNADLATATVVSNSIMGFDFEELVGSTRAFINFSESFFTEDVEPIFSPHHIVIEVLENVPVTETVIASLKRLKQMGYTIALDDFIFKKEFIPFLKLADIIKIDIENISLQKLPVIFNKIRRVSTTKLLAERVETKQQFEACMQAEVDYFQGYFFAKPEIVSGKKVSVSALHLMELLQKITDPTISLEELESIIIKDVGMTHKMLKLARQFQSSNMPEVDNLGQVLRVFGLKRVQNWVATISMSSFQNAVPEVFNIARTRAIFLRRAAEFENLQQIDSFYLVGMLSLIDTILGSTMEDALNQLPLNETIKKGLLDNEGDYGRLIKTVNLIERSETRQLNPEYIQMYLVSLKESTLIGNNLLN